VVPVLPPALATPRPCGPNDGDDERNADDVRDASLMVAISRKLDNGGSEVTEICCGIGALAATLAGTARAGSIDEAESAENADKDDHKDELLSIEKRLRA
jgi:hypothetical protein